MKKTASFLLLFIVSFFSTYSYANFSDPVASCAGTIDIPETECQALLRLYNATDGDNWYDNTNRGSTGDFLGTGWYGVTVSGGSVTEINLGYDNLSGSLPSMVFSGLSNLTNFSVYGNQITNIYSGTFLGLPSLTILGLGHNQIASIETGTLSPLSSLITLYLGENQITILHSGTFVGLSSLLELDLSYNQMTSISGHIFNGLSNLETLYLYGNQLTTITDLNSLDSLYLLDISFNHIDDVNDINFSDLSGLLTLGLGGNQITTIGSGVFSGLVNLESLYLYSNQIATISDTAFTGLGNLQYLDLNENQIENISNVDFIGLGNLTTLTLQDNKITNIHNGDFIGLSSLQYLNFYNNDITTIDIDGFTGLTSLTNLELRNNYIITLNETLFLNTPSLTNLLLHNNCIDQDTLSASFVSTLFSLYNFSDRASEKVCPTISYNPSTTTSSPVVATIGWTGGNSADRITLASTNTAPSHTFTTNGSYAFDLSTLNNIQLLRYTDITGTVTWIVPSHGGGGGGGGGSLVRDNCPGGDFSDSYYDSSCGISMTGSMSTGSSTTGSVDNNVSMPSGSSGEDEMTQAYRYAFSKGITTMNTMKEANMFGILTRAHLAKMIVRYMDGKGRQADTSLPCDFPDVKSQSTEMQGYIRQACQLGLMGVDIKEFHPNSELTRADFGTVFSRMLRGNSYNGGNPYYRKHLQALKDNMIMTTITNPGMIELRGYVMLMMMRSDKTYKPQ